LAYGNGRQVFNVRYIYRGTSRTTKVARGQQRGRPRLFKSIWQLS
jgi:hypothetical protein